MAELTGAGLYAKWSTLSGTTTVNTDFRTFSKTGEMGEADKTAGADTQKTFIKTTSDGAVTSTFLHDGGTTNWVEFTEGLAGTLVWGEAGTANNAPKHTMPAWIKTTNMDTPYDNVELWNVTWRPSAARVDSFWTNGA